MGGGNAQGTQDRRCSLPQIIFQICRGNAASLIGLSSSVNITNAYCSVSGNTLYLHSGTIVDTWYAPTTIVLDAQPAYITILITKSGRSGINNVSTEFIADSLTKVDFSEHPANIPKKIFDMEYTGISGNSMNDALQLSEIQSWPAIWQANIAQRHLSPWYLYRIYF